MIVYLRVLCIEVHRNRDEEGIVIAGHDIVEAALGHRSVRKTSKGPSACKSLRWGCFSMSFEIKYKNQMKVSVNLELMGLVRVCPNRE